MPQLDGLSIVAFASFAALIASWLVAPSAPVTEPEGKVVPAAA